MSRQMTQTGPTHASPRWAGDYGTRDSLVPGGVKLDPAQFLALDAVRVVVGAAGALAAATTVPVDALSGPIPDNTLLDFGGAKFARLNGAVIAGATSMTVDALATALVDNDLAIYPGVSNRSVPSGTVIGRTLAERDLSTPYGPADAADADGEIFITFFEVTDVTHVNDAVLYRHNRTVKENYLPGFASLASGVKDKVRALYNCVRGAD